jgi:hypothetical protein
MIRALGKLNEAPPNFTKSLNISLCPEWLVWQLPLCSECHSLDNKLIKLIFSSSKITLGRNWNIFQMKEVWYLDKAVARVRNHVSRWLEHTTSFLMYIQSLIPHTHRFPLHFQKWPFFICMLVLLWEGPRMQNVTSHSSYCSGNIPGK